MPKIILATDAWAPQVNGVVKCVEKMQEYLIKNGFEVIVLHPGLFFSIPTPFYPEIRLSLFCKKKIKEIIKEEKPDFVHIFTEGSIGLKVRSICKKNKFKFTTSQHTNFQTYIEHYLKINIKFLSELVFVYLRWFHNKSNAVMAITENLKKNFEDRGFKNVVLWPLGVDTDLFIKNINSDIKERNAFKSPIFVYFGRIAKEKNVEEFLKLDLSGTKLVIGDGPIKKDLEKKYGKINIFVGYKIGQELVDYLSVCDVFVFPSLTDAFPLAIVEAKTTSSTKT